MLHPVFYMEKIQYCKVSYVNLIPYEREGLQYVHLIQEEEDNHQGGTKHGAQSNLWP